jgi:hypothetical protein
MARGRGTKVDGQLRAYAYLRLSVDKEDGKAQSIEAQRNALRAYALREGIKIVEEFADSGLSGQSAKRPEFNRMIEQATDGTGPVEIVLMFAIARMARNMRLFFNSVDALADAGVEVVSITENFGEGRSKRIGQTITAMMAEQQALDSSRLHPQEPPRERPTGFLQRRPGRIRLRDLCCPAGRPEGADEAADRPGRGFGSPGNLRLGRHGPGWPLDRQNAQRSRHDAARGEVLQQQPCRHSRPRHVCGDLLRPDRG